MNKYKKGDVVVLRSDLKEVNKVKSNGGIVSNTVVTDDIKARSGKKITITGTAFNVANSNYAVKELRHFVTDTMINHEATAKLGKTEMKVKVIQKPKEAVMKLGYQVGDLVTPKRGGLSKSVKMNHLYLVEAVGLGVVKLYGVEQLLEGTIFKRKFNANTNAALQQVIVNVKKGNPAVDNIYIEAYRTVVVLRSGAVGVAKLNKADKKDFRIHAIYVALARAVEAEQLKIIEGKRIESGLEA